MSTHDGTLVRLSPDHPEHAPPGRRLLGIGRHATDVRFAKLIVDHAFDQEEEAALVSSCELNGRVGRHIKPSAPQGKTVGIPHVGERIAFLDFTDSIHRKEALDSQVKAMSLPPREGELDQLIGIRVQLQVDA
jgi:hypothetical protein